MTRVSSAFILLLLYEYSMASVTVNLKKKQYDKISDIADRKYRGNFSKALRMELRKGDSTITITPEPKAQMLNI